MGGGIPGITGGPSGPAVSEADGGQSSAFTGAFTFKTPAQVGLIERALPLIALGVVAWLLTRR